jgi:hypothetical protein
MGVVSLVARIGDSAPSLMLVVCQTAREIEERLFDGPSVAELCPGSTGRSGGVM